MKTTKYIGLFINDVGHKYELKVDCFGFIQAFFLLTADAIRTGKHYQLNKITDEKGNVKTIDDILHVSKLIKDEDKNNSLLVKGTKFVYEDDKVRTIVDIQNDSGHVDYIVDIAFEDGDFFFEKDSIAYKEIIESLNTEVLD